MRKSILIIGYVWVEPTTSAAGMRMLQLIDFFLAANYSVIFASPAQKSSKTLILENPNYSEASIVLNSSCFDTFVTKVNPSVVLFDRFMMEEQFGWRVAKCCPNALRILDTEDLHFLRKVRQEQVQKNIPFSENALLRSDYAKREIAAILRCDLSLIISSYEMALLTTSFNIASDLLLYLPFFIPEITKSDSAAWLPFEERKDFIFVGNFLHAPNVDAAVQLKKQHWDKIRKKNPQAKLHIYGAYGTQQIQEFHKPKQGFLVHGYVNDIKTEVGKARVVLAPLRFGAGIKGKLTEAMTCGTPSVTTEIGAEGMHKDLAWNGFVSITENDFIDDATTLYTDKKNWEIAQKNGISIVNTIYNETALAAVFLEKLNALETDLSAHRRRNFMGALLQYQTLQSTKYMSKWIEEKNKR
ncbi:glycosyltransferase [Tenacibaculum sp. SG-28]|uniref:glycosyltransferase n=1 Tax=Tenacibaculum sp. SG-28 TaxID=754426 RepID=UPI0026D8E80E